MDFIGRNILNCLAKSAKVQNGNSAWFDGGPQAVGHVRHVFDRGRFFENEQWWSFVCVRFHAEGFSGSDDNICKNIYESTIGRSNYFLNCRIQQVKCLVFNIYLILVTFLPNKHLFRSTKKVLKHVPFLLQCLCLDVTRFPVPRLLPITHSCLQSSINRSTAFCFWVIFMASSMFARDTTVLAILTCLSGHAYKINYCIFCVK